MNTVLLLSGGIDSIALAYWKTPALALTIDYGQRSAEREIEGASFVTSDLGIPHRVFHAQTASLGCGIMSESAAKFVSPVPEWWPFRNQFLITIAAMQAVREDCDSIMIGTVKSDRQMKDGSPDFFVAMRHLLELQEGSIELLAPALEITSVDLVKQSKVPLRLLAAAHSCHVSNIACGHCRGCVKHRETMAQLGVE
jgi:7-cyano-7-deazaguanine synthase